MYIKLIKRLDKIKFLSSLFLFYNMCNKLDSREQSRLIVILKKQKEGIVVQFLPEVFSFGVSLNQVV